MNFKEAETMYYKVVSSDKKLWYGTFRTREEAEDKQKEYPNDDTLIKEIDTYGREKTQNAEDSGREGVLPRLAPTRPHSRRYYRRTSKK